MISPFIGAVYRAKETFPRYFKEGTVVTITGKEDRSWKISTVDGKEIDGTWSMDPKYWDYITPIYNKPARLP